MKSLAIDEKNFKPKYPKDRLDAILLDIKNKRLPDYRFWELLYENLEYDTSDEKLNWYFSDNEIKEEYKSTHELSKELKAKARTFLGYAMERDLKNLNLLKARLIQSIGEKQFYNYVYITSLNASDKVKKELHKECPEAFKDKHELQNFDVDSVYSAIANEELSFLYWDEDNSRFGHPNIDKVFDSLLSKATEAIQEYISNENCYIKSEQAQRVLLYLSKSKTKSGNLSIFSKSNFCLKPDLSQISCLDFVSLGKLLDALASSGNLTEYVLDQKKPLLFAFYIFYFPNELKQEKYVKQIFHAALSYRYAGIIEQIFEGNKENKALIEELKEELNKAALLNGNPDIFNILLSQAPDMAKGKLKDKITSERGNLFQILDGNSVFLELACVHTYEACKAALQKKATDLSKSNLLHNAVSDNNDDFIRVVARYFKDDFRKLLLEHDDLRSIPTHLVKSQDFADRMSIILTSIDKGLIDEINQIKSEMVYIEIKWNPDSRKGYDIRILNKQPNPLGLFTIIGITSGVLGALYLWHSNTVFLKPGLSEVICFGLCTAVGFAVDYARSSSVERV